MKLRHGLGTDITIKYKVNVKSLQAEIVYQFSYHCHFLRSHYT
jgi:hypothetical protein